MKRLVSFVTICALLVPIITAVSPVSGPSSDYLSRGDFIQVMYETYVDHSGITVQQEQARTRPVSSDVIMTGGFGTCLYFDDIDFPGPLFDATGWADIHGISNGTGPGEYNINVFSPHQTISIQEALTMTYRMVVNSGNHLELSKEIDVPSTPAWAQDAVQWWMTICPDDTLAAPTDPCNVDFASNLFAVIYQNYTISF